MIKGYFKRIAKQEFYRKIFTVFSGTSISQAIPILLMPVLTRIFPEKIFGIFFIYSSALLILKVFATLKYEMAIFLAKNEEESVNILALCGIITLIITALLWGVFSIFPSTIVNIIDEPGLKRWLPFLPLSVLFVGFIQALNHFNNRNKKFIISSYGKVIKSSSGSLYQLVSGFLGHKTTGLIYGLIAGQFFSFIYLITKTLKKYKQLLKYISLKKMISLGKQYKRIPLYNTLIAVINTLSNHIPIFLLTKYFGAAQTSQYGLAVRVIRTPMGLIQQSFGEVFFQEASQIHNNKQDILNYVKKTYMRLFKIGIVPFIIAGISAPFLFKFIFGDNWELAGRFTQVLIPWIFLTFLNAPISNVITILHNQHKLLVYNILLLISRFVALYIGYSVFNSVFISILLFSTIGFVFNIFLLFFILLTSKQRRWKIT
mgnify:CR=1 FL=1